MIILGLKIGGFKAISLNKIKHNQLLMQKWMITDDTMFTGSIFLCCRDGNTVHGREII